MEKKTKPRKKKYQKSNCIICGKRLTGRQQKFCSIKCQKRSYTTAKKLIRHRKNNKVAYVIHDPNYGDLEVFKTANAWWRDEIKVRKLIKGYKLDCKPRELRALAGISADQLRYFLDTHPDFSFIFKDMRSMPSIVARQGVVNQMKVDGNLGLKYLEKKEPDEFKDSKEVIIKDQPILIDDVLGDDDNMENRKGGGA